MCRISAAEAGGVEVCAFLDGVVAFSEIGAALLANPATDDGYKVLVGCTPSRLLLFQDYSDHPRIHNAALNSDAAGRYQIMGLYWPIYKRQLALPDFSPLSQDKYAIQQIKESRALKSILSGNISTAIRLCAHIWASFPTSGYGQHENSMDDLLVAYENALSKQTA